jgi:adenylate kinase
MTELNLIFLGPPGAGKGTQAQRLRQHYELPYVATGDILREAVRNETELGREAKGFMDAGDLVPDEVVIGIVSERLKADDATGGFLLDGFPRTVAQAEALGGELGAVGRSLTAVIFIDVDEEEVVRRISGRRVCEANGHSYHVEFDPPEHGDVCDADGSPVVQRDDDKPETVKARLMTYNEHTAPLIDYYAGSGLLRRVDGNVSPEQVQERILALISTLKLEGDV